MIFPVLVLSGRQRFFFFFDTTFLMSILLFLVLYFILDASSLVLVVLNFYSFAMRMTARCEHYLSLCLLVPVDMYERYNAQQ